jgi:cardiolipin synthase
MSSVKKIKTTYTFNNHATHVRGGKEYFDQLKTLIERAQHFIQLQVYILEKDHTGNEINDCLIAASRNNVRIQILLDGYASRNLRKTIHSGNQKCRYSLEVF